MEQRQIIHVCDKCGIKVNDEHCEEHPDAMVRSVALKEVRNWQREAHELAEKLGAKIDPIRWFRDEIAVHAPTGKRWEYNESSLFLCRDWYWVIKRMELGFVDC